MKKLKITLLSLLCLVLIMIGGCSVLKVEKQENTNDESLRRVVASKDDTKKDNEIFKNIEYDTVSFCLNLIDWDTNRIIKKIEFEKNELVFKTFKFNHGYAVINFIAEKPIEIFTTQEGYKSIKVPKQFAHKLLHIYDFELNLLKEINLEEIFPEEMMSDMWSADVSLDGNKVVWAAGQKLYVYNIESDSLIKVFAESNPKSLHFSQIRFAKDGKSIVYFGNTPEDGEVSMSYGIVELSDGNIINFHQRDYEHAMGINISSRFACITDCIDGWSQTSSGSVLVLDLFEKRGFLVKVDGTESTFAKVSEDGQYLIAANENINGHIRVRQYRLNSGTLIKEEKYFPNDKEFRLMNILEGEGPSRYYFFVSSGTKNKECFEFVCKEE